MEELLCYGAIVISQIQSKIGIGLVVGVAVGMDAADWSSVMRDVEGVGLVGNV